MTIDQLYNTFTYHKPFGDQPQRYEMLRENARKLALDLQMSCPESREKSLAFTHLQQAIMWANASIAINEKEGVEKEGIHPVTGQYDIAGPMEGS
jgi:hypothetical protein